MLTKHKHKPVICVYKMFHLRFARSHPTESVRNNIRRSGMLRMSVVPRERRTSVRRRTDTAVWIHVVGIATGTERIGGKEVRGHFWGIRYRIWYRIWRRWSGFRSRCQRLILKKKWLNLARIYCNANKFQDSKMAMSFNSFFFFTGSTITITSLTRID